MQHFEFRSFSRLLKGRTRTATFTLKKIYYALCHPRCLLMYLCTNLRIGLKIKKSTSAELVSGG